MVEDPPPRPPDPLDPEDPALDAIRDARGSGRAAALAEWSRLVDDLAESGARGEDPDRLVAEERLRIARRAMLPPRLRDGPRLFYTGARIEQTWTCLNKAGRALLALVDEGKVRGRLPFIRAAVLDHLDREDPQRAPFLERLDQIEQQTATSRTTSGSSSAASALWPTSAPTSSTGEVRALRNVLLILCAALFGALAAAALLHLLFHTFLSVCGGPPGGGDRCPGGSQPGGLDVLQIEIAGGLGGLVSAVPSLRGARRMPGPYSIAMVQILFKFLSGAAVALIAILLLQAGALAGLPKQPGSQLVGYAAFFGLVQQALTTLADQRVSDLAHSGVPKAKRSTA